MKRILVAAVAVFFGSSLWSQTVVYDITEPDFVGLELTSGDVCTPSPYPPEEAKQTTLSNQWGGTWTSTGSGVATSVQVEVIFTICDLMNIPTLLNGNANNSVAGANENCGGTSTAQTWNIDPADYNVGGTNTFLCDFTSSSTIAQIDHIATGTPDIFIRITVDYSPCTAPTASLNTGTDVSCKGGSDGAIDIDVTGGTSPYTFDWDNDGTGDFDDAEDLTGLMAGTYNVTVKDDIGCTTTFSYTVNQPTGIDVTVTQDGSMLTANASGLTYQWLDCDNSYAPISGETNVSYTATTDGSYAVEITDNPCIDTSDCVTIVGAGIEEMTNELGVEIFPNPSNGQMTIQFIENVGQVNLSIFDLSGREVENMGAVPINGNTYLLNASGLSSGTYILNVNSKEGRSSVFMTIK